MTAVTVPKTFVCETCGAVLKAQRELDNHMCLLHDDCGEARLGTPITFRCAGCDAAFELRSDLFAHQQQAGHGNPAEWDKARPPGAPRPRRSSKSRRG